MKKVTNKFGTNTMYEETDLGDHIYCACTACMSVWSDMLSFANKNPQRFDKKILKSHTDTIIILGCQVTDLAIYNDLMVAEKLFKEYPEIPIYMGGCLAQRFDIELPEYIRRLDVVRKEYIDISKRELVDYKKPFWNMSLSDDDGELAVGNLFRNMYPLKIGAGCHGKCKYCTIRETRGKTYYSDAYLQIAEFLNHADEGVVIVSDSPTVQQIKDWCHISERYHKPISFRNVEPQNANTCRKELFDLSKKGLLKIFHCPIQSNQAEILMAMNRNVPETMAYIEMAQEMRENGTILATNIIIDYTVDGKMIHNMDVEWLNKHFDYWSWNPYFDGCFDFEKAEKRFYAYIGEKI